MLRKEPKNYVGFSWMQNWFHPPMSHLANASAEIHDSNYKKGGNSIDRMIVDMGFIKRIFQDIELMPTFTKEEESNPKYRDLIKSVYKARIRAYRWTCIYFIFVRTFGWIAFKYKKNGRA